MRIRLIKSWKFNERRTYPVGTVLQVLRGLAKQLVTSKHAEIYEGEYPPKDKLKMDLKQLKVK